MQPHSTHRSIGRWAAFLAAILATSLCAGHAEDVNAGPTSCESRYHELLHDTTCERLFRFEETCQKHVYGPVVSTALKLRCADALLEKLTSKMKEDMAGMEQAKTCAAATAFVDKYGQELDLAEAPEMEKAAGLRVKLCEEEARQREIAQLEAELVAAMQKDDCATFETMERQKGPKLSAEQSTRLTTAKKKRCEFEQKTVEELKTCLDRREKAGAFCQLSSCYDDYKRTLPGDAYFSAYASDSRRSEEVCRKYRDMESCFSSDACGAERCSLPLRLAIGTGILLEHTEKYEQGQKTQCEAVRERERLARLEQEREEQRRKEEAERERRAASTTRLTLCNKSTMGKIYVVIGYYDYDADDWIVEGWWHVEKGECTYIGDNFRRGTIYFYAHTYEERYVWAGNFGLCVSWGKFRRVNKSMSCPSSRHRLFIEKNMSDEEYEQTFVD